MNILIDLGFAVSITGPIFLMVLFGVYLKKKALINESFIAGASNIVFRYALPIVLFRGMYQADLQHVLNPALLFYNLVGTLLVFLLLVLFAPICVQRKRDFGVFIQGGFRGNLGIVGLAFSVAVYGEDVLAMVSVLIAGMTVAYNCLSVYVLHKSLLQEADRNLSATLIGFASNPLIIGISAGVLCNLFQISIPIIIYSASDYVARLTLPLALICVGGALSFSQMRLFSVELFASVFFKLLITPILVTLGAYMLGFSGRELGVTFLLSAAPTATASFVMVEALRGNGVLAANIIGLSTFLSIFSLTLGLTLLKAFAVL